MINFHSFLLMFWIVFLLAQRKKAGLEKVIWPVTRSLENFKILTSAFKKFVLGQWKLFSSPAYEQTLTADLARLLVSFSNVCLIVELLFIRKFTDNQSNLQKKLLCLILCQKSCYFTTSNMSNHHFAERKCQVLRKTFHLFLLCFKVLLVF